MPTHPGRPLNPVLAQPVDVRLNLSEWLLLLGWAAAEFGPEPPVLIERAIRGIAYQVNAKVRPGPFGDQDQGDAGGG